MARRFGIGRRPSIESFVPGAKTAPRGGDGLTAAASRITRREAESIRRLIQQWQAEAFFYYDRLGEIKYAAQFYSRGLAPLELYAGEIVTTGGRPEIIPTEDPTAIELLERIQDPGGGRSGMLSAYGKLKFLTGECCLFVTSEGGHEQWEMLSTDELRVTGAGTYVRYKAPSLPAEEFREPGDDAEGADLDEQEGIAYRLWTKHPRYSWLADSTMMAVLGLCEELLTLTQVVRARARSRLAGPGWLLIPEELTQKPVEAVGDEDPREDPFIADLTDSMMAGVTDEGSPSTQVPLISRVSAEFIEKIRHIQIVDPTQIYPETGLRRECIERIAIGLDLPPEILLGLSDANHWNAWQIDEQVWKSHLMPMAQSLCDDLTSAYFRPSLELAGVADPARFVIAYDATAIINHPDRTRDAKELHDRGVIGDAALREAAGFDEDDQPTALERQVWLAVKARDPGFAVTGISSRLTPEAGLEVAQEKALPGQQAEDVLKEPPQEPTPQESQDNAGLSASLNTAAAARIIGAADLALLRAREAAGNRVRSLAKRNRDLSALLEGVRPGLVCATLGRDAVRALGLTERELVAAARELVLDAALVFGIKDADVRERIADLVEQHAARTLYEVKPSPLPPTFHNFVEALGKQKPKPKAARG